MDKAKHLAYMEDHYKVKPERIADCLAKIKQGYAENLDFYLNEIPDPKEYTKACNDMAKHAKGLKRAIDSHAPLVREDIGNKLQHHLGIPQREGDPDFLLWLSGVLDVVSNAVDGLSLNRHKQDIDGNTEAMTRKPDFHKDCLVRALVRGYLDLPTMRLILALTQTRLRSETSSLTPVTTWTLI